MAYTKTNWVNGTTPINETNLNKIENELESLDNSITSCISNISAINNDITTINNSINTINTKLPRKIITAKAIRQNIKISTEWANVKIPLSTNTQIGNKFTISSNSVKIGSGVSKILVSAHCSAISFLNVAGDKQLLIYKNEDNVGDAYIGGGSNWEVADISPFLLDVEQDDLISLRLISGQAGSVEILPSYLTVEVAEET